MRYKYPSERNRYDWSAHRSSEQTPGGPSAGNAASNAGTTIVAYLITGPLVYGGIGHLVDRWLGTSIGVGIGALIGMTLALYTVWLRYGRR
ncbi:MAG: hypothetical protein Q4G51_16805 [Dermatophilus congolensis]|nr:hypothetical protein [Dermatophilus congolensis]